MTADEAFDILDGAQDPKHAKAELAKRWNADHPDAGMLAADLVAASTAAAFTSLRPSDQSDERWEVAFQRAWDGSGVLGAQAADTADKLTRD